MNTMLIAFLLSLSPSDKFNDQIQQDWNSLLPEERKALIQQFEEEYAIKVDDLTPDQLSSIQRQVKLRSWDGH